MSIIRVLRALVALVVGLAAWLAWPSRNVHGNPVQEQLVAGCTTATGTEVRLYEGNGGATTAYWHSVTMQGRWFEPERQVFFAYSSPSIKSVACGEHVLIAADTQVFSYASAELWALRAAPRAFWRGVEGSGPAVQPLTVARYVTSAVLGVMALVLLFVAKRLSRARNAT